MKITVIGLGYVGAVSAGCLARRGHEIIGVDVNPRKVAPINDGEAPVLEPGLPEAIARGGRVGSPARDRRRRRGGPGRPTSR